MGIPTIELRGTGVSIATTQVNAEYAVATSRVLNPADGYFGIDGSSITEIFDLYENGSLLANGRTWQCPMMYGENSEASPPLSTALQESFFKTCYDQNLVNASLTYINDGSLTFMGSASRRLSPFVFPFYEDVGAAFNGQFVMRDDYNTNSFSLPFWLPPYVVPVFIQSAYAGVLIDLASDAIGPDTGIMMPWTLASSQPSVNSYVTAPIGTIIPRPYFQGASSAASDDRQCLTGNFSRVSLSGPAVTFPYGGFGLPRCVRQVGNAALGRVAPPTDDTEAHFLDTTRYADLRCLRTAASHATIDWPGRWPVAFV